MIKYDHEKEDKTNSHRFAEFTRDCGDDVFVVLLYVMVFGLPLGRRDAVRLDVFHPSRFHRMCIMGGAASEFLSGLLARIYFRATDLFSSDTFCARVRRRMVGPSVLLGAGN